MPDELDDMVPEVLKLPSIQVAGIATNLGCFNGAKPDEIRMIKLIELADQLKCNYDLDLEYISGGNSANYKWFIEHTNPQSGINNLRIGEAILLGHDPQERSPIKNLQLRIVEYFL